MPIKFVFSRGFLKNVKQLRKRYRLIEYDIDALLVEIQSKDYRGDVIPDVGGDVYKVRLTNRSAQRGKSGGFRALFLLNEVDLITFIYIYSKSDKNDVTAGEIRSMLRDLGQQD